MYVLQAGIRRPPSNENAVLKGSWQTQGGKRVPSNTRSYLPATGFAVTINKLRSSSFRVVEQQWASTNKNKIQRARLRVALEITILTTAHSYINLGTLEILPPSHVKRSFKLAIGRDYSLQELALRVHTLLFSSNHSRCARNPQTDRTLNSMPRQLFSETETCRAWT
jgi:hypothetical protein